MTSVALAGDSKGIDCEVAASYHYCAFATRIESFMPLPLLPTWAADGHPNDSAADGSPVRIYGLDRHGRRGDGTPVFHDGHCTIAYAEGFEFKVDGRGIGVSHYEQAHQPLVQQRLLTTGLAAWFYQVGQLQMHASAFDLQGKRIMVVGRRGAGKSCALRDALALGGSLVADDVALIDTEDRLCPSFPAFRLLAAQTLPGGARELGPVPGARKKRYARPQHFADSDVRRADLVVVLAPPVGAAPEVEWLTGTRRAEALLENGYRPGLYLFHPRRVSLLHALIAYAGRSAVVQVTRPDPRHGMPYQSLVPLLLENAP